MKLQLSIVLGLCSCCAPVAEAQLPRLQLSRVPSSLDGAEQPVLWWAPSTARTEPTVLFVFVHSWSGDYRQNNDKWQQAAVDRGWIFLHPNFRGINDHLEACGSKLARRDVLDAIDFACATWNVDRTRIYLAGVSGGGHMAMLMAGHHPDRFSAVSAWVGISDLADWHAFHAPDLLPARYAWMIGLSTGGPPGFFPHIDEEYRDRSPLFHIHRATELPLDLNAGILDGHTGSVPVAHSLRAFNRVAEAHGNLDAVVDESLLMAIWDEGRLRYRPIDADGFDRDYGVNLRLRRVSGQARVTIFEGGHESFPFPACEWLSKQRRPTLETIE